MMRYVVVMPCWHCCEVVLYGSHGYSSFRCGNGWFAEKLTAFGPVTLSSPADALDALGPKLKSVGWTR